MRITLFIIFCILAVLSASRAVSGDTNEEHITKENKSIDSSENPFEKKETPLSITRKLASNAILSLVVFVISAVALILLSMI